MNKMISYITILLGFLILTACGDDNNRVTTQELNCTADSYYDYDDEKWYLSRNDRRECRSNANNPNYYGGDWNCADGQVAARVIDPYSNSGHQDSRYRSGSGYDSNIYGGFGWEFQWGFCSSINGGPGCHTGQNDIHNVRDRDRYHVPRDDYYRRSGNFHDGNYRVVCIDRNDRNLYRSGGYYYYEYRSSGGYNGSLSTEEALTFTAIGVLLGLAIGS
jgi:hypothetical protein